MKTEVKTHQIKVTHPKPHSKKQELIMNCFVYPGIREMWVACGTKFGKSLSGSCGLSKGGLVKRNGVYRWIAPIYKQSLIGMEYFTKLLPPKPHCEFKKSDMQIEMKTNGSRIEFWHGQNPYDLEGAAVDGTVFDEAAKMKEQVYISARTTHTRTRGPMLALSTPLGKNWFYQKCMEAKEHQEWSIRNGKQPTKVFIKARTEDNPYIAKEVIEQARSELPARLFKQFYEAEFLDDGTVFTNILGCVFGEKLIFEGPSQYWIDSEPSKKTVVIGVDWAKQQDYTVFFAADIYTKRIVGFNRFHKVPYTEQVRKLYLFAKKFGEVCIILHDKTGVGTALDDLMAEMPFPYQGVTLNNNLKADYVTKLMTSMEQTTISFPNWDILLKELEIFEVGTTPTGLPMYSAPEGKHDDTVVSLFLVNVALLDYSDRDYKITFLDELQNEDNQDCDSLSRFYDELIEDADG